MSFNGSGTFVINSTGNPVVTGTVISSTWLNALTADLATGLSTCVLKDGSQTITANIPMSSYKLTGLAAGTSNGDSVRFEQLTGSGIPWIAAGGTADAITATYSPAVVALSDGLMVAFRASAANTTTTPTFAPSGLTAHTITKNGGSALLAGDISAALDETLVRYNLSNTRWELLNPAPSTAVAALLAQNNTWTKAQRGAYVALTSSANSIAIDLALSNNFTHTLTENTTLAAPSNVVAGQGGVIQFTQHASSAKTLAYNSFWRMGTGVSLTISTTVGSVNEFCYVVDSTGAFATCTMQIAISATPAAGPNFTASYTSGGQTITAGGALTLAHSLGAIPTLVRCYIKCTSTELNYAVNDLVEIGANMRSDTVGRGVSIIFNITNLVIRFGSDANSIEILDATTGAPNAITNSKWQAFFKAWA